MNTIIRNPEMKNISNYTASAFLPSKNVLPKTEAIVWCCAFTVSSAIITTGNLLTVALFAFNKRLQKKCFVFLVNMALADLMLGAVSLPLFIYSVVWRTSEVPAAGAESAVTIFRGVFTVFYLQASIMFASLISGERVFATYWPLRHRTVSLKSYRTVTILAWTIVLLSSTILSLLRIFVSKGAYFWLWVSFTLSLTFITCSCNIGIWRKFRQRGRIAATRQNRASQNRHLTKTLLFISLLALLSWLPIIIINIFIAVNILLNKNIYFMAVFLNISSCFVNPITYVLRFPEFGQALTMCCCRRKIMIGNMYTKDGRDRAISIISISNVMDTKL